MKIKHGIGVSLIAASTLLISACGGGSDDGGSGDTASGGSGNSDSQFAVCSDEFGEVPEVCDQGGGVYDVSDSVDPENSVSVRITMPEGWRLANPTWSGQSPNPVKAIFTAPDVKAEGADSVSPRVYLAIKPVEAEKLADIPLGEIANLPDFQQQKTGDGKLGSKPSVYVSGSWAAPAGFTGRTSGTVISSLIPSGDKNWLVTVISQKPAQQGDDEASWQADLESITSNIGFKSVKITKPTK